MFAVWFLQLVGVPSPRYDRAGRAFSVPQLHTGFCRSGEASPKNDLKTSKQEGEVRRRTVDRTRHLGAVLCYLGNSQSAIRTVTNGKRGGADQANLNARRGAQVGAGGEEGVGRGWGGGCGARFRVVRGAGLRRRDPAASGDSSGGEPTKGKLWPTAESAPRAPALRCTPPLRAEAAFVPDAKV